MLAQILINAFESGDKRKDSWLYTIMLRDRTIRYHINTRWARTDFCKRRPDEYYMVLKAGEPIFDKGRSGGATK